MIKKNNNFLRSYVGLSKSILKKFTKPLILLLLSSCAFDITQHIFENKTAGIKLIKPSDWHFLSKEEYVEGLGRVELQDKSFQERLVKNPSLPLVIIAKYPEPYDDINPSVKIGIKSIDQLKEGDPKKTLESVILPSLKTIFKNYQLDQEPVYIKISGLKAAYARISYSLDVSNLGTFPMTSEFWIVPSGKYIFMIGAGIKKNEDDQTRKKIKEIINSIEIEPSK